MSAASEGKAEDGSCYAASSFTRSLPIPPGVDKNNIKASFTEEGGVLLEAPADPPQPKAAPAKVKGPKALDITHE